jgi:predicted Zn-dependent protease
VSEFSHLPALDEALLSRWIEPLARNWPADLFFEWRSEWHFRVEDGQADSVRLSLESGVAARARREGRSVLAAMPSADEAGARDAVRRLADRLPSAYIPKNAEPEESDGPALADASKWSRRLTGVLARGVAGRAHRFEIRRRTFARAILRPGSPLARYERTLLSVTGEIEQTGRGRGYWQTVVIHAPEADREDYAEVFERLRTASAGSREVPPPAASLPVLLDGGSAAFFFHEVLSHPLEADSPASKLFGLSRAHVAPRAIEVTDEPSRLDLFGGYPFDDEGTPARRTPLLSAGHLAGSLRDQRHSDTLHPSTGNGRRAGFADHAAPRGANVVVAGGSASDEEMMHRAGNGIRIERFDGGSVDPASGLFRLRFPEAQSLSRGRPAQALGPGFLEGEILESLSSIDESVGNRVSRCRELGWCSRDGKVVPAGGEAPAVLLKQARISPL